MSSNQPNDHEATQGMQISFAPDVQRGVYANQTIITHSQEEFLLDFIFAAAPAGVVNARVVVTPGHAKRIAAVLMDNVAKYEAMYGEIEVQANPPKAPGAISH